MQGNGPPLLVAIGSEQVPGGGGGVTGLTVTVALVVSVPPGPVQVIEYDVVEPGVTDVLPPIAVEPPFHIAAHDVALVLDQVRVLELPAGIAGGDAVRVAFGPGTVGVMN